MTTIDHNAGPRRPITAVLVTAFVILVLSFISDVTGISAERLEAGQIVLDILALP